jgi:hypothetical protein
MLAIYWASLVGLLVVVALAARRPTTRAYIPGLTLIGVGVAGALVRRLGYIPPDFLLAARTLSIGIAIVGLILVERVRVKSGIGFWGLPNK